MKAVLYARVSSEKQAEKDLSISAQLKALRKYAADKGFEVVREFIDEAESARTANRHAFQEMISLARSKEKPFDAVLVWKLSRFARNREDSTIYKSQLRKKGVQVISMNEQIDDSPSGKLLEGMIEAIDEFYSENLSQEARRGLKETASRGFFPGGSVPMGYKLKIVPDGRTKRKILEIDSEYAPIVKRVFKLCLAGLGTKEIAGRLNSKGITTRKGGAWSKASIVYILRNDIYTGDLIWPDKDRLRSREEQIIIRKHHQAIVSKKDFNKVQELISDRSFARNHPRRVTSNYLLSGLLYCGKCGKTMLGGTAKSGRYRYYGCYSRLRLGISQCSCKAISSERFESAVIGKLQGHVLTEENLIELLRMTNEELAHQSKGIDSEVSMLKKHLALKTKKLDKLYEVLEEGHLTSADLAPRIRSLSGDADKLRLRINELEIRRETQEPHIQIGMADLKKYVQDLKSLLLDGQFFERRSFLRSFIKRIDYAYPEVVINYTFPINLKKGTYDEVLSIDKKSGVNETRTLPDVNLHLFVQQWITPLILMSTED
jgi:site-specific DNA recombinase